MGCKSLLPFAFPRTGAPARRFDDPRGRATAIFHGGWGRMFYPKSPPLVVLGVGWMQGGAPGDGRRDGRGRIVRLGCGCVAMTARATWLRVDWQSGVRGRAGVSVGVYHLPSQCTGRRRRCPWTSLWLRCGAPFPFVAPGENLIQVCWWWLIVVVPLEAPLWSPCFAIVRLTFPPWIARWSPSTPNGYPLSSLVCLVILEGV